MLETLGEAFSSETPPGVQPKKAKAARAIKAAVTGMRREGFKVMGDSFIN
jgi:hypothetical protein